MRALIFFCLVDFYLWMRTRCWIFVPDYCGRSNGGRTNTDATMYWGNYHQFWCCEEGSERVIVKKPHIIEVKKILLVMNQIINFSLSVLKQYRKICQKTTFYKYFFVKPPFEKKNWHATTFSFFLWEATACRIASFDLDFRRLPHLKSISSSFLRHFFLISSSLHFWRPSTFTATSLSLLHATTTNPLFPVHHHPETPPTPRDKAEATPASSVAWCKKK